MSTAEPLAPRVLCVDDEPRVLEGLERTLGARFDVTTAPSGVAALERLRAEAPFAVIVSDMRMPLMSGAAFLARARQHAPDTVRILLTGQADLDAAMAAVNEGAIFRFLTKPCPPDRLAAALDEAVHQYRLVQVERELLEKTLTGTIALLSEVLAIAYPGAFDRAQRGKTIVRYLCDQLMLDDPWIFEAAALLAPLGLITIPDDVIARNAAQAPLRGADRALYLKATATTERLLANIPRLEVVAAIIGRHVQAAVAQPRTTVEYGAGMLRLTQALVPLIEQHGLAAALVAVRTQLDGWELASLALLDGLVIPGPVRPVLLRVGDLRPGMVLLDDVRGKTGMLLAPAGQVVSALQVERLRQFADRAGVEEPIRVQG